MSTQSAFKWTQASMIAAINANGGKLVIDHDSIGKILSLQVAGNGNFLPAGHKSSVDATPTLFGKHIYNVRAYSKAVMLRPDVKAILAAGIAAESAGNMTQAEELYRSFMNKIQLSFTVGERSTVRFTNNEFITGRIATTTNKKGEEALILEGVSKQAISNVSAKAPLELLDLAGLSAEATSVFTDAAVDATVTAP